MAASYLLTMPVEVKHMIAKKLGTYRDLKNLCIAFPKLQNDFSEFIQLGNAREAMEALLEQPESNPKVCRLVCKQWKDGVDHCMDAGRVNLSLTSQKSKRRLIPTLVVPLRGADLEGFQQLVNGQFGHATNKNYLKGSLQLRFQQLPRGVRTDMAEINRILDDLQDIWKSVKHLEIDPGPQYYYDDDDRVWAFKAILQYMSNVQRVVLNDVTHYKPVVCLPNLGQLEEIVCLKAQTNYIFDDDDDLGGWKRIVGACQLNLKLLHVPRADGSFLRGCQFPRLEELCHTFGSLDDSSYPPNFRVAQAILNVKVLSVECRMSDWLFLKDLTHRLTKLNYLHVRNLGPYQRVRRPWLPKSGLMFGSNGVKYLKLEGGNDGLASLFPKANIGYCHSIDVCPLPAHLIEDCEDFHTDMKRNPELEEAVWDFLGQASVQEEQIIPELINIASVAANETVLKSESLWKYLGGQKRISYERYQKIVSGLLANFKQEEHKTDLDMKQGMEIIQRRFGSGFFHGVDYDQEMLVEADWLDIVSNAIGSEIDIAKFDGCNWEVVLGAFQIYNATSGQKLMQEFYSKVVPFLSNAVNFGYFGMKTALNLEPTSRNAMIAIYHLVKGYRLGGRNEIALNIDFMMGHRIIPRVDGDKSHLVQVFKANVMRDDAADYFATTVADVMEFRRRFRW